VTLEELANKYGTDKYVHGYCPHYEAALTHLKNEKIRFLEIGVDRGWSMHMWRDFFPNAELIGLDIVVDRHDLTPEQATIMLVNFNRPDEIMSFAASQAEFDVIIDDGGHTMSQQQRALDLLWDKVKPGGFFIMEDMHTSLRQFYPNRNPNKDPTTLDMMRAFESDGTFSSRFMPVERFKEIKSQIESAKVIQSCGSIPNKPAPSITSIVRKATNENTLLVT
jgi:hypothetical protein